MKKSEVKKICAELFNKYMGIKIPSTAVTLMELTADENKIDYVYFTAGNRHYVYNDKLYRSFVYKGAAALLIFFSIYPVIYSF